MKSRVVLRAFAVCLLFVIPSFGSASTLTCADFLKVSTVPRIAALGEASVAISDATWAEANPANLPLVEGSLITFSHAAWFQDISLEMLTVGTSSGAQAFGVSLVGLHTEPLERYDTEDRYLGQFRYYDFLFGATYARAISPSLRLGVSGKTVYEKIDWDSATGFALDLGLAFSRSVAFLRGDLSGGLTMRNLGPQMGYFENEYSLPLTWQGGFAYKPAWLPKSVGALLALDYRWAEDYGKPADDDQAILAGLELEVMNTVTLRLGNKSTVGTSGTDGAPDAGGAGGSHATLGLGVKIRNMMLDYCYLDLGDKLGATHRVSMAFRTGSIFPSPEESK